MVMGISRGPCVLCFICVLAAACQSVHALKSRLPTDIVQWNYTAYNPERERFWGRDFLRHGILSNDDDYEQVRPLFEKLDRGEPILVLGLGSSLMEGHGGCFHTEAGAVKNLTQKSRPRPETCDSNCLGYVGNLMKLINQTWPHKDHMFLNAGVSACGLSCTANSWCSEGFLPRDHAIDLVVFSDATQPGNNPWDVADYGFYLETVYQHTLHKVVSAGALPMIVVEFSWVTANIDNPSQNITECIRQDIDKPVAQLPCSTVPECSDDASFVEKLSFLVWDGELLQDNYRPMLDHYGWGAVSIVSLMRHALRTQMPKTLGWNSCHFVEHFFKDLIHPRGCVWGELIIGDLLADYFVSAQEKLFPRGEDRQRRRALQASSSSPEQGAGAPRGLSSGGGVAGNGAGRVFIGGAGAELTPRGLLPRDGSGAGASRRRRLSEAVISAEAGGMRLFPVFDSRAALKLPNKCYDTEHLPVHSVAPDRWHYIPTETARERAAPLLFLHACPVKGEVVFKPGWHANETGASLWLEFSSEFRRLDRSAPAIVTLSYLSSYEHMGRVEVACAENCACSPGRLEVNAHDAEHHFSVQASSEVNVTQHRHCRIRLTVLDKTDSGERKFKLVGLDIRASSGAIAVGRTTVGGPVVGSGDNSNDAGKKAEEDEKEEGGHGGAADSKPAAAAAALHLRRRA